MDDGQENPNQNSGAPRQAIFTPQNPSEQSSTPQESTPQQKPDSAVPETPVTTPTQPSAPAAHPYFSSHPTATFASETGDIILNGDAPKTKSNKKGLIAGLILIAILVVVLIVVIIMGNNSSSPKVTAADVIADFQSYQTYLEDGPENSEKPDPDEWYFFQLDEIGLTDSEQVAYTDELQSRFEKFQADFNVAKSTFSDITREQVETTLSNYAPALKAAIAYVNISANDKVILEKYANESEKSAEDYIDSILPSGSALNIVHTFVNSLREVYQSELRLAAIYNQHECLVEGELDIDCAAMIEYSGEFAEINENTGVQTKNLNNIYPLLQEVIIDATTEINSALSGGNNE